MKILRAADRPAAPWKNGGGVTREVAVFPEGADLETFAWRVSIAEIGQAGAFSRFDGVERTLAMLSGRMRLSFADRLVEIDPDSEPLAFGGEEPCHGEPLCGPARDLNVMTRRGRFRARVARAAGFVAAQQTPALFLAATPCVLRGAQGPAALDSFDAALMEEPFELSLDGAGFAIGFSQT